MVCECVCSLSGSESQGTKCIVRKRMHTQPKPSRIPGCRTISCACLLHGGTHGDLILKLCVWLVLGHLLSIADAPSLVLSMATERTLISQRSWVKMPSESNPVGIFSSSDFVLNQKKSEFWSGPRGSTCKLEPGVAHLLGHCPLVVEWVPVHHSCCVGMRFQVCQQRDYIWASLGSRIRPNFDKVHFSKAWEREEKEWGGLFHGAPVDPLNTADKN